MYFTRNDQLMGKNESDVIIIGAGLTGLALAYYLKEKKISVRIIEARNRVGGRIHTVRNDNSPPIELGATWIGKQHTAIIAQLKELKIDLFEQILGDYAIYEPISTSPAQVVQLPPNNDPSFRIKGGSDVLIETLAKSLNTDQVILNETIYSISLENDQVTVAGKKQTYTCSKVVSTLPPHLFVNNILVAQRVSRYCQYNSYVDG